VFMPFQVVLLPMSQVLGWLGLSSSIVGLILVHLLAGLPSTTLFFRNYYAAIPKELLNAARMDGAGFWKIFVRIILPMSLPIVMVTLIWQFTQIWNDFLFGVAFSGADSKPITVGLNNLASFCDATYEDLVQRARLTTNKLERVRLYRDAQQRLKTQLPWYTIAHTVQYKIVRRGIKGIVINPVGRNYFYGVELGD